MPGKRYDGQSKLSAAKLVLERDPGQGAVRPADVPCRVLGKRAAKYGADGEDAFPGSGNPVASKDYEIPKLKKENGGSARRPRY